MWIGRRQPLQQWASKQLKQCCRLTMSMLAWRTLPGLTWSSSTVQVKLEKERDGFPLTSIREINILLRCAEWFSMVAGVAWQQRVTTADCNRPCTSCHPEPCCSYLAVPFLWNRSLNHPHIVNVSEVVVGPSLDSVFMVMEYADHDLKAGGCASTIWHQRQMGFTLSCLPPGSFLHVGSAGSWRHPYRLLPCTMPRGPPMSVANGATQPSQSAGWMSCPALFCTQ